MVPEIEAEAAVSACGVDKFVEFVAGFCWAREPADHARSIMPRNNNLDLIY
jgi:hypothetical protein